MVDHKPALNDLLSILTSTRPDHSTTVLRAAFVGRTSTDDNQDPTLSIPRQVSTCHTKLGSLPTQVVIVAHYWDIETGRLDLDQRSRSTAHQYFDIPTPRDGGITDLLAAAESPNPGFDVVITESISRTARDTRASIEFEYHLTHHDIPLWCADEPIDPTTGHTTAANTLLRGVNRAIADWYVRNLIEQSRGGTIEHVKAGYNIGRTPYGYTAHCFPHPVPAKRARGQTKTLLMIDPDTAPIVTTIFTWRTTEHLGYHRITDRLNTNLTRYPAPNAGTWSTSTIAHILHNPKYTGYQVYNRTRMKTAHHCSKTNPPAEWIWSPHPVHPAIITIEQFTHAQTIAPTTARSRNDCHPGAPNPHPYTKNVYKLRSYITCAHCGRRLCGRTDNQTSRVYYFCQPPKHKRPQDHPPTVILPEDQILTAVSDFLNTLILGVAHRDKLHTLLNANDHHEPDHHDHIDTLQRELTTIDISRQRLIRNLAQFDRDDDRTTVDQITQHLRALQNRYRVTATELETLTRRQPDTATTIDDLLNSLPTTNLDLTQLPAAPLRKLLDAHHFTATYDHRDHHAHLAATVNHQHTAPDAG